MNVEMSLIKRIVLLSSALLIFASPATAQFELVEAFPHLRFDQPADFANDGQGYLYVVERPGRVYRFPNDTTTSDTTAFLDIRDRTSFVRNGESGFLGLAFHPNFEQNGYFYTYYTTEDPLRSVLSRWERSENDRRFADPTSELVLLEVEQPTARHNAGDMAFGPDGYLYVAFGDGSEGGDQFENAQNLETLLGSIIRIDVDSPEDGKTYDIPDDNPFAGNLNGYREEIYAYGFRNPWRFSIDPQTGDIWAGDVGEQTWEEVDYVVKGGNYGWPIMEGPDCYDPPENCSQEGLFPPVFSYNHTRGRAVIGGYVYRGSRVPELQGRYVFAEWNKEFSQMWAITYDGSPYENPNEVIVDEILDPIRFISTFGVDERGELYMLFTFEGRIMWFRSTAGSNVEQPRQSGFRFELSGPNPFDRQTTFELSLAGAENARVVVYDSMGRLARTLFTGFVPAGDTKRITFDADSLPNGAYFIRMESDSHRKVVKTLLLQ